MSASDPSMKEKFGCLSMLLGFVLVAIAAYVHYSTIADIPAASMTLRLEWSGWEWGVPGVALLIVGFIPMSD